MINKYDDGYDIQLYKNIPIEDHVLQDYWDYLGNRRKFYIFASCNFSRKKIICDQILKLFDKNNIYEI